MMAYLTFIYCLLSSGKYNICQLKLSTLQQQLQEGFWSVVTNTLCFKCSKVELFFVIACVKKRHVFTKAGKGLSYNWCTQWVKYWSHAEKIMFSSQDLKTRLFQHDPMTLPTIADMEKDNKRLHKQSFNQNYSSEKKCVNCDKSYFLIKQRNMYLTKNYK